MTRTPWTDWYVDGDRSAVFVDGEVLVLSELATEVLHHVAPDAGADLAALAEALTAAFGAPPDGDATAATEGVVRELADRGVLAVS
ncbi:hypothetical protein [Nocardioides litoris]|uniref:hypothetical protein n=1 Tax=Nocardioides litoris TaxID=1926648 RepID=UPI0014769956|nr:hypothetical protein [Nocardioides litoris]